MSSEDPTIKRNPARYRALSEPFPSADAADDALKAFFDAVHEARVKFKIQDAYLVTCVGIAYPDGEGLGYASLQLGNPLMGETLTAYAYGRERAKREETIAKVLSGKASK